MYEVAMHDWHVPPHVINESWTEELLALMFIKRGERLEREAEAIREAQQGHSRQEPYRVRRSNEDFFRLHGVRVHKHG